MTTSIMSRPSGFSTGEGTNGPVQRAARVWEYRRILRLLVGRDLKVRYANSALGYFWTILEPLAMSGVYWFVFIKIVGRHIGFPPFILFLVAGQLPWYWISGCINGSVSALRSESQMVRSSNVPREIWVLRVVLSKGVEFLFSLPVLALFALAYLKAPSGYIVLMPLGIVMTIVLCTGLGMIIAPASVLVADIKSVVRIAMRVLFYLSPVLYSVSDVTKRLHAAAGVESWNPVAGILVLFRAVFFSQELNWTFVLHSAIVSVVIFAIGLWTFRRLERPMLKEI
jgi:ABC-2 type transport system permease protein